MYIFKVKKKWYGILLWSTVYSTQAIVKKVLKNSGLKSMKWIAFDNCVQNYVLIQRWKSYLILNLIQFGHSSETSRHQKSQIKGSIYSNSKLSLNWNVRLSINPFTSVVWGPLRRGKFCSVETIKQLSCNISFTQNDSGTVWFKPTAFCFPAQLFSHYITPPNWSTVW